MHIINNDAHLHIAIDLSSYTNYGKSNSTLKLLLYVHMHAHKKPQAKNKKMDIPNTSIAAGIDANCILPPSFFFVFLLLFSNRMIHCYSKHYIGINSNNYPIVPSIVLINMSIKVQKIVNN